MGRVGDFHVHQRRYQCRYGYRYPYARPPQHITSQLRKVKRPCRFLMLRIEIHLTASICKTGSRQPGLYASLKSKTKQAHRLYSMDSEVQKFINRCTLHLSS